MRLITVDLRLRKSKTAATTRKSTTMKGMPVFPSMPRPMNLKLLEMLLRGRGMAWESTKARPRAMKLRARVTMNGDSPTRVTKKPFMNPIATPTARPTRAMTAATDRSMPPPTITSVMPMTTSPLMAKILNIRAEGHEAEPVVDLAGPLRQGREVEVDPEAHQAGSAQDALGGLLELEGRVGAVRQVARGALVVDVPRRGDPGLVRVRPVLLLLPAQRGIAREGRPGLVVEAQREVLLDALE